MTGVYCIGEVGLSIAVLPLSHLHRDTSGAHSHLLMCLYKCKPKFATISSSDLDLFYFSNNLGTYAVVHPGRGCDFFVFNKLLFLWRIMTILNPASTPVIPDDDTSQQQHTDIISDYEPRQGLAVV